MSSDGILITNIDDNDISFYKGKAKLVTVSLKNPDADYWADDIQRKEDGLNQQGEIFNAKLYYIYAIHNVYSALYAFAAGVANNIKYSDILRGISNCRTAGIRNNFFEDNASNLEKAIKDTFPHALLRR